MSAQNIFELLTDDPVQYNIKAFKAKLAIALVALIKEQGLSQASAAEKLSVTQPRMSNLFRLRLEKFSIDALLVMLVKCGYKIDTTFDPANVQVPISMEVKRAML